MSYKYVPIENVEGIRKVKWDGLWHVLYRWKGESTLKGGTYDRVSRKEAMAVMKKIEKHRNKC